MCKKGIQTLVIVDGETLGIGIDEKVQRVDHKPTPQERKKNERNYWPIPKYDFVSTGKLILKIRDPMWLGVRQQWADGKVQRIEHCLGAFVLGLQNAAHVIKEKRKEDERREKEWEEERKRAAERHRQAMLEEARVEKFLGDANYWETAKQLRCYIQALEKVQDDIEGLPDWIDWARDYVSRLDPFSHPETLVFKLEEDSIFP